MKIIYGIFCFLCFFDVQSQTVLNGLQACYPLDCISPAVNQAGTGAVLNGTVFGNVTCTVGHLSQPNTAMKFGGTAADYIALPANNLIKPTTSITVSGWYYVTSLNHQDIIFTRNLCSSHFNGYNLISDAGTFIIHKKPGVNGSCAAGTAAASAVYPINTWHHVVLYLDDTKAMITVDNGAPVTVIHNVVFEYDPSGEVILGGTNEIAENNYYSGFIDDLRFYDRQLTSAQIDSLYKQNPGCALSVSPPTASFTVDRSTICVGESVIFSNKSSVNSSSYQWQAPGGNPSTSSMINPVITYSAPGIYNVILTASNSAGQSSPFTSTISVQGCVSLAEYYTDSELHISPNPGDGLFLVNVPCAGTIELRTLTGQCVYSKFVLETETLNLLDQPAGIYLLSFRGEHRNSIVHARIIVSK